MKRPPIRLPLLKAHFSTDTMTIVKRAAELQGRSVSDFIVAAAQEAAQQTIEETQIIRLSAEDRQALADSILEPAAPTRALRRAQKAHRRLITQSR